MSVFKKLNSNEIILSPYVANKLWTFNNTNVVDGGPLTIYLGKNEPFTPNGNLTENGEYQSLVYASVNQLFYQKHSNYNYNTGSLMSSLYYEDISETKSTGSYFIYNDNPKFQNNFPTGSNEGIVLIQVKQEVFGSKLQPTTVELGIGGGNLLDDGYGNLLDGIIHVGNVFYSHGMLVITNQDYIDFLTPLVTYPFKWIIDNSSFSCEKTTISGSLFNNGYQVRSKRLKVTDDVNSFPLDVNNNLTIKSGLPQDYYNLASSDPDYKVYDTGSCALPTVYGNAAKSASATKNNCSGSGETGTTETYTIASNTYFTVLSQTEADNLAQNAANAGKQAYANSVGSCIAPTVYSSVAKSGSATKNNCSGSGETGTTEIYTINAGSFTSIISQADADNKAQNAVDTGKQAYANTNGSCIAPTVYYNVLKSGSAQIQGCNKGTTGSTETYVVSASVYNSIISQADADNKAQNDVNTNKQTYANAHGSCNPNAPVTINYTLNRGSDPYVDGNFSIEKDTQPGVFDQSEMYTFEGTGSSNLDYRIGNTLRLNTFHYHLATRWPEDATLTVKVWGAAGVGVGSPVYEYTGGNVNVAEINTHDILLTESTYTIEITTNSNSELYHSPVMGYDFKNNTSIPDGVILVSAIDDASGLYYLGESPSQVPVQANGGYRSGAYNMPLIGSTQSVPVYNGSGISITATLTTEDNGGSVTLIRTIAAGETYVFPSFEKVGFKLTINN